MSLRAALGAGRGRLVRQLLTESVLLAVLAGVVALPIAMFRRLRSLVAQGMASTTAIATIRPDFSLDARVLGVALLLALAQESCRGWRRRSWPCARISTWRSRPGAAAHRASHARWFRSMLVVVQVALSLMLLVSGGLFLRSLDRARQIELGFDPDNLVVASAIPTETGYDAAQRLAFYTQRARADARSTGRGAGGLDRMGTARHCQRGWTRLAR